MRQPPWFKEAHKLLTGILVACIFQFNIALPIHAQPLRGVPVPADSLHKNTLQRYLTLSFDLAFNKPDEALLYGRRALTIARHLKKPDEEAKSLENIGYIFYDRFKLDSATVYFSQALQISTQSGSNIRQSNARSALGQVYFRRQQYVEAFTEYEEALRLLQQENMLPEASAIYNNISLVHKETGNYSKAIKYLLLALELNEKAGNKKKIALNLSNLGLLYKELGDYSRATSVLKKALQTARASENIPQMISAFINLGMVHTHTAQTRDTTQFALAWKYLNEAKVLSIKLKDKRNEAVAYHDLADIALERQQLVLGEQLANKALEIKKEIGANQSLMHSFMQKAKVAKLKGILPEALSYAAEAVAYANQYGSLAGRKSALELYAHLLAANNNSAQAFRVLQQHQLVTDSLLNEQKAKYIAQAEIAYETNKKQRAINRLEGERQTQRQQNIYLGIIAVLIFAGASLLIMLQRKKMLLKERENSLQQLKLRETERERAHLKEELQKYTSELIQSNKAVLQLQEQLGAATNTLTASKTELSSLKVLREEDWLHFKSLFQTVYPSFFTVLKTQYPGLSANDIRLAALFRLGLSTREMAGALGVEIESVKKARHRLRKKLDCNPEQDLVEYFTSLG